MNQNRFNSNFLKILIPFTCIVLSFLLGLYIRAQKPGMPVEAASQSNPAFQSDDPDSAAQVDSDQITESNPVESKGVQSQMFNGIEVEAANFRREGKHVKVDMCFSMPDERDWSIWEASLITGAHEDSNYGFDLIEFKPAEADSQKKYRCDTVYFDAPSSIDITEIKIRIDSFAAPPQEFEICASTLNRVQKALDEQGLEIKLDCVQEDWGGGLTVSSKPDSMTQAEAEQIVFNDVNNVTSGPWIFQFTLEE